MMNESFSPGSEAGAPLSNDAAITLVPAEMMPEHNAKCRQIFDGARQVFLAEGFDGASMNDIARAAGVSKGTLYVYFASKEALFEALIRYDRSRQAEQLCQFDANDHNVRSVLVRFGTLLAQTMTQPNHIAHTRTVMGVVPKFPQIGRAFYEAGPMIALQRLASYLEAQSRSGVLLDIGDTELAAQQFVELCKASNYTKLMLGMMEQPTLADIQTGIGKAMDAFFKIYPLAAQ